MQGWRQQLILQVHREALQAELKMIRDDLHRVVLELTERQQRVDRLHAKWDTIAGGHKGEDGEEHSQASQSLGVACCMLPHTIFCEDFSGLKVYCDGERCALPCHSCTGSKWHAWQPHQTEPVCGSEGLIGNA